jgi:hypothetical protein
VIDSDRFINAPSETAVRALRDRVFGAGSTTAERVEELCLCRFVAACVLEAGDRGIPPRDYWASVRADVLDALIDRQIESEAERQLWAILEARLVDAMGEG